MATYRMYVDESGSPGFKDSSAIADRYFSLTGVIVDVGYAKTTLTPALESLKARHFDYDPDVPPIFHRSDMVARRGIWGCLKDQAKGRAFWTELAALLSSHDYRLVTAVIDKKHHRDTHKVMAWEPYRFCLQALLGRYVMFLGKQNRGDVLIEVRGKTEDRHLRSQYTEFFHKGDYFIRSSESSTRLTSRELKVRPKGANIAALQIADIIAQDLKNEILADKVGLQRPTGLCDLLVRAVRGKHRGVWPAWGYGRIWIGP